MAQTPQPPVELLTIDDIDTYVSHTRDVKTGGIEKFNITFDISFQRNQIFSVMKIIKPEFTYAFFNDHADLNQEVDFNLIHVENSTWRFITTKKIAPSLQEAILAAKLTT